MKRHKPTVSIVIPNWNGAHLLKMNIPYVKAAAKHAEIIIADDASSDDSIAYIKQTFPAIQIVSNKTRQGFSGNVNRGVEKATGDIVVLLNSDVRPEKNFLDPIIERFSDPTVAAVGCLEKSHEQHGIVLRGRGIAHWEKGYFVHARGEVDAEDTAWVSGGSSAYRKRVWDALGGMDERFNPFYWEDIDLSYRIKEAGFMIVFERRSVVHHYHDEGAIRSTFTKRVISPIVYRNQYIFHWKHIPNIMIWCEHVFWTPIRLVQAVMRKDWAMIRGFFQAIGTYI